MEIPWFVWLIAVILAIIGLILIAIFYRSCNQMEKEDREKKVQLAEQKAGGNLHDNANQAENKDDEEAGNQDVVMLSSMQPQAIIEEIPKTATILNVEVPLMQPSDSQNNSPRVNDQSANFDTTKGGVYHDQTADASLIQPVNADADRTMDGLVVPTANANKQDDMDYIESDRGITSPKQGLNERKN